MTVDAGPVIESIGDFFASAVLDGWSMVSEAHAETSTAITPYSTTVIHMYAHNHTVQPGELSYLSSTPIYLGPVFDTIGSWLATVGWSRISEGLAEAFTTITPTTTLPKREAMVTLTPVKTFPFTIPTTAPALYVTIPTPYAVQTYMASIEAEPMWTSASRAYTSAMPESVYSQFKNDPHGYVQSLITAGTTPSWASAIPTSYLSYRESVLAVRQSLWNEAAKGPAPTNGAAPTHGSLVKVFGAAMAVGVAGLAML